MVTRIQIIHVKLLGAVVNRISILFDEENVWVVSAVPQNFILQQIDLMKQPWTPIPGTPYLDDSKLKVGGSSKEEIAVICESILSITKTEFLK